MSLGISKGLHAYLLNHGSLCEAMSGGAIYIFKGDRPASANHAADPGNLLAVFTTGGLPLAPEFTRKATITLQSGGGGSVDSVTLDGVELLESSVPFTNSLIETAQLVAREIMNAYEFGMRGLIVRAVGITIEFYTRKNWGAYLDGKVLAVSATEIVAVANGFPSVGAHTANGVTLFSGGVSGGDSGQDGTNECVVVQGYLGGVCLQSGAATWFRFSNGRFLVDGTSVHDVYSADSIGDVLRIDGDVSDYDGDKDLTFDTAEFEAGNDIEIMEIVFYLAGTHPDDDRYTNRPSKFRLWGRFNEWLLDGLSFIDVLRDCRLDLMGDPLILDYDMIETQGPICEISEDGNPYTKPSIDSIKDISILILPVSGGSIDSITIDGAPILSESVTGLYPSYDIREKINKTTLQTGIRAGYDINNVFLRINPLWREWYSEKDIVVSVTSPKTATVSQATIPKFNARAQNAVRLERTTLGTTLKPLAGQVWAGTAQEEGEVTWFRFFRGDDYNEKDELYFIGSVGTSDAGLVLPDVNFQDQQGIDITDIFSMDMVR